MITHQIKFSIYVYTEIQQNQKLKNWSHQLISRTKPGYSWLGGSLLQNSFTQFEDSDGKRHLGILN